MCARLHARSVVTSRSVQLGPYPSHKPHWGRQGTAPSSSAACMPQLSAACMLRTHSSSSIRACLSRGQPRACTAAAGNQAREAGSLPFPQGCSIGMCARLHARSVVTIRLVQLGPYPSHKPHWGRQGTAPSGPTASAQELVFNTCVCELHTAAVAHSIVCPLLLLPLSCSHVHLAPGAEVRCCLLRNISCWAACHLVPVSTS
jgi:hypothetical protein